MHVDILAIIIRIYFNDAYRATYQQQTSSALTNTSHNILLL